MEFIGTLGLSLDYFKSKKNKILPNQISECYLHGLIQLDMKIKLPNAK